MHPYIIIQRITIHTKVGRKSKVAKVIKKRWYKIKASYLEEYQSRYIDRAEKKYGENVIVTFQYKQKCSRKEYKKERKIYPENFKK